MAKYGLARATTAMNEASLEEEGIVKSRLSQEEVERLGNLLYSAVNSNPRGKKEIESFLNGNQKFKWKFKWDILELDSTVHMLSRFINQSLFEIFAGIMLKKWAQKDKNKELVDAAEYIINIFEIILEIHPKQVIGISQLKQYIVPNLEFLNQEYCSKAKNIVKRLKILDEKALQRMQRSHSRSSYEVIDDVAVDVGDIVSTGKRQTTKWKKRNKKWK